MSKTSIQQQAKVKTPLHLRLTAKDWEECCKMLNYAEMKVFIWIRASDPYGVRELKFSCSKLGEKLGLHKSSVSRALKSLDGKQLIEIDFEDVRVTQKVSNRRLTLLCKEENDSEQEQEEENKSVAPTQRKLHPRNAGCTDATPDAPMQRPMRLCNDQPSESLPSKDSKTPQTYLDFIKTLSESERENFLKFCEELTSNLSSPVNDIEAWLAHKNKAGRNRWQVYYQKLLVWQEKQTKKYSSNRSSQMKKKFQEEIEQQQQQAIQTWESKHD